MTTTLVCSFEQHLVFLARKFGYEKNQNKKSFFFVFFSKRRTKQNFKRTPCPTTRFFCHRSSVLCVFFLCSRHSRHWHAKEFSRRPVYKSTETRTAPLKCLNEKAYSIYIHITIHSTHCTLFIVNTIVCYTITRFPSM